jgi:general secretion pathway protein J
MCSHISADMHHARPERGFTLVEMLVAIAIFGVVAGIAYRTLDASLVTRARVTDEYRQWREVIRAMASIQRDIEALEPRPVRLANGEVAPALVGLPARDRANERSDQPALALTRAGEPGASGRALAPRRVAYRVRENALELLTWPALDQGSASIPDVVVVANGIAGLALRYRDVSGRWEEAWPPAPVSSWKAQAAPEGQGATLLDFTLPVGVEVTLWLPTGQRVTRVVPVPTRTPT